jgi:stage V sporulation protein SpoVS
MVEKMEINKNNEDIKDTIPPKSSTTRIGDKDIPILRVGSRTKIKPLAGAIAATIKECGWVELRCIGDGAIGRAIRAGIIAKGYVSTAGVNLINDCSFFMTEIDDSERTGVRIRCEDR